MGKKSRTKGNAYERKIARKFATVYAGAKRGIGQARSASEVADVDNTPWWIECKDHKAPINLEKVYKKAWDDRDQHLLAYSMDRGIVVVWKRHLGRQDFATIRLSTMIDLTSDKANLSIRFPNPLVTLDLDDFLKLCKVREELDVQEDNAEAVARS